MTARVDMTDPFALGPALDGLKGDLREILTEEARSALDALTPEQEAHLEGLLVHAADLSARHAAGEDVVRKLGIVKSALLDYAAVAATVLQRGVERALQRGLTAVAIVLGAIARQVLRAALGGALPT